MMMSGETVKMISGRSAYRLGVWSMWLLIFSPPLLPLALVLYVATGSNVRWQSPAVLIIGIAGIVGIALAGALVIAAFYRGRKEIAAGYTTMVRWHQDYKQVDPFSGKVIRDEGQPYIQNRPEAFDGRKSQRR